MDRALGGKPMQVTFKSLGHVEGGWSAIERAAARVALGGHVMRCEDCSHTQIAYNSCPCNRHCPKCQARRRWPWMKQRKSELLDRPLLPRRIHAAGAELPPSPTRTRPSSTISCSRLPRRQMAHDCGRIPKRLGRQDRALHLGAPHLGLRDGPIIRHVHMIVPGGGISLDGKRWISLPSKLLPCL